MRQYLSAAADVLDDAINNFRLRAVGLAGQEPPSLLLINLRVENSERGYEVLANFRFGEPREGSSRSILFAAATGPLRTKEITPRGLRLVVNPPAGARATLPTLLSLDPGCEWDSCELAIRYDWALNEAQQSASTVLSLPQALHGIMRPARTVQYLHPRLTLDIPKANTLQSAWIKANPTGKGLEQSELLQCGLVHGASKVAENFSCVLLTDRLTEALGERVSNNLRFRLQSYIGGLNGLLGTVDAMRLVLIHPDDAPHRLTPGCLCWGLHPRTRVALNQMPMLVQLAAAWWGAACKLYGNGHQVLEDALTDALALYQMSMIDTQAARDGVLWLQAEANCSSWKDIRSRLRGWPPISEKSAMALRIHALLENPSAVEGLKEVTREAWGKAISVEEFNAFFNSSSSS